jgi:thiamine-monophosphate kinase
MAETLRDRGEAALLEDIRTLVAVDAPVVWGPGDDAALLRRPRHPLLVTTDALVEHVHFRRPWISARDLGRRAFEVNASDIAAMGGRPLAAVLAVAARPDWKADELRGVVAGVAAAARAVGAALAGVNLSAARELSVTVALVGEAPWPPLSRAGARPGDRLFVTGELGGAAFGLRLLRRARSIADGAAAVRRWRRPTARLTTGCALARRRIAAAMIDVSDGLLVDAGRLCRASGVGARLELERLPVARDLRRLDARRARVLALTGGEDYELLFAVRPRRMAALASAKRALGCRVTAVGEVVEGGGVQVVDGRGRPVLPPARGGHLHFRR